jgi:hypothetical protein
MGLSSEMKNLSEEILASFKQRIKENEELVNDVQKTLDGFHKDHQEMASVLNANAASLRNNLTLGEKERIKTYNELMAEIHQSITSIQEEVKVIQNETLITINEFTDDRSQMAEELSKFFAEGRADLMKHEKNRKQDFDVLMKDISIDIKSINAEVALIFKETNEMLDEFEKDHLEMSSNLRTDLRKNLTERVAYTRTLLNGFQKRLSEISKENQKVAQKLKKDLDKGEVSRLNEYTGLMKGIHSSIKGIQKEVIHIQKTTSELIGDYAQDRSQSLAEWNKMQAAIAELRETGLVVPDQKATMKVERKEIKKATPAEPVAEVSKTENVEKTSVPEESKTLEQKVLDYITNHPNGVKISEMEEPLGETRMKLGFIAKALLDRGKVQKMDNVYFPIK